MAGAVATATVPAGGGSIGLVVPAVPTGVLLVATLTNNTGGASPVVTAPAGWLPMQVFVAGGNGGQWARIAVGGDSGTTFMWTIGAGVNPTAQKGVIVAYSAPAGPLFGGAHTIAGGQTLQAPSVQAYTLRNLIIEAWAADVGATSLGFSASPNNPTVRVNSLDATFGGLLIADYLPTATGATTGDTATVAAGQTIQWAITQGVG